jgi:ring-1,2-phenylacetyl-CoA epoxidase subunit PaaD
MGVPVVPRRKVVTVMTTLSLDHLRTAVGEVCDPELPPLTLGDLGILRSVELEQNEVVVTVTPTYSGCPAVEYIEDEIRRVLQAEGCEHFRVERAFTPSWTTDWITANGRRKMLEAGIAPPQGSAGDGVAVSLGRTRSVTIPCPRCGSDETTEISHFGSTACKSLHRCNQCAEPFDHFKDL